MRQVFPFTILRPVVIYGEGEKGNFATFFKISRLPIPLPFGMLTARRSVLSIQNFNSAVGTALSNSRARGETFIVSDPSTGNCCRSRHTSPRQFGQIVLAPADTREMA